MNVSVRVVLDTNVLVSALVFRAGAAAQIRQGWLSGRVVPLASQATVQELMRVLAYPKFHLSSAEQDELLADYLPHVQTVRIPKQTFNLPHCRDVLDMPFLQLAVAGKAKVLVSGDHDFLSMSAEFERASSCTIVPLNVFCQTYCA